MARQTIQELLDSPSDTIRLPEGYFQGPVTIRHPCVVHGNQTTIWANQGPAVVVTAQGVSLHHLRIHVRGGKDVCVRTEWADTTLSDVEVNGPISGFPDEKPDCVLRSFVEVGSFAAYPAVNQIALPLHSPGRVRLSHSMRGVELSTDTLSPGLNEVVLTIRNIEDGRTLYGSIEARGDNGVRRRIMISGQSAKGSPPKALPAGYPAVQAAPDGVIAGDRRPVPARRFTVAISPAPPRDFDVEPFVFLLGQNMKVRGDGDLIFFNQRTAASGCVAVDKSRVVHVDLDRVEGEIQRIFVCYSILNTGPACTFDHAGDCRLRLRAEGGGEEYAVFPLKHLHPVKTIGAIQIYRYARTGEWKIFFEGQGYAMSLPALCKTYGVDAR